MFTTLQYNAVHHRLMTETMTEWLPGQYPALLTAHTDTTEELLETE